MARISVRRVENRECGCKWCQGHEQITHQIVNLETEGLTDDQIGELIEGRFEADTVLDWRVWSEAEYMRAIRAKELPFAMVNP